MKWLALWIFLAVLTFVGIGQLNLPFYLLLHRGVWSEAAATRLTPEDHHTVHYEYEVGGKRFQGHDQSWKPNPPVERIRVGQVLAVYYDPKNPGRSALGNRRPMLANELIFVGLSALAMPTVFVLRLRGWVRKRRARP
jgi:hypothetical protein